MKVNATKFYTAVFVILLLMQLYLPSFKSNIYLQIFALIIFFTFEKFIISKTFLKTILPIICLFLMGFLGTIIHKYALFNISKDIFHYLKPIVGITIGYCFYRKINCLKTFIKTIVIVGLISAFVHFWIIFFVNHGLDSVTSLREFAKDNFLELFALFFLVFYKKFQKDRIFQNKTTHYFVLLILIVSTILYLSRTTLIAGIILLFGIYGLTKITTKTLQFLGVLLVIVLLFYSYLFTIKLERGSFLYKIKIAPSEIFETHIDRNNHADLWDHWRGYEAKRAFELMADNPSSYLFGCGYGSLVDLKFKAPLTNNPKDEGLRYISELHNGYVYIIYKSGFLGLIILLMFMFRLYFKIYKPRTFITVFISGIGLFYFFTTLTITGIYNTCDSIIFILGGLLYFEQQKIKQV